MQYKITGYPQSVTLQQPVTNGYYVILNSPANFTQTDSFTFYAYGGGETSGVATCTIVAGTNSVPVANPVSMIAFSGMTNNILVSASYTHASEDWGQTMTSRVAALPAHGTAWASQYRLYYKSQLGYSGTDTFTWAVSDGVSTSAPAAVSVTVPEGYAPVLKDTTNTYGPGVVKNVDTLFNATWTGSVYDLQFTVVDLPRHMTLRQPPGTPSYRVELSTPTDYTGPDSFTYYASGGGDTSRVATFFVVITTNSVPVTFSGAVTASAGVTSGWLFSQWITHAYQDDGQPLTGILVREPDYGDVSFDSSRIYYTAPRAFAGTDTFVWAISDGIAVSEPATITVTVGTSVPVPSNQSVVAVKNTPLTIYPDYAGAGYDMALVKVSGPSHGTVTPTNGMTFRYTPTANYTGTDSFSWRIAYSNATTALTNTANVVCSIVVSDTGVSTNWAQWRYDECRSGKSPMTLPDPLYLQWRRDLQTAAPTFGAGVDIEYCRPVQLGKNLIVSLLASDSVSAYDTDTGALKWRYYTSGALRRPPAAAALSNGVNVVIFGCDDGYVYALNVEDGTERWKLRAAPSADKSMIYGRLASQWPVWASPVIYGGKVYFVAGFLPTWFTFGYCLDAATGQVIWHNDGRLYDIGHNSGFGPLAFSTDHTKIYGTVAQRRPSPWIMDPATGDLSGYVPWSDTLPDWGDWYIGGDAVYGNVEPKSITVGGRTLIPTDIAGLGVAGTLASMLAGDGKLFAVTTQGSLYCFGASNRTATVYLRQTNAIPEVADGWAEIATNMLSRADLKQGIALVLGIGSGRLVEELARWGGASLMVVAVDPDANKVRNLRVKMDGAGWSGTRMSTITGNPLECGFAPHQAALITSEDLGVAGWTNGSAMARMLYESTRPFGGEVWLPTSNSQHAAIAGWLAASTDMPLCDVTQRTEFAVAGADGFTQIRRLGLPDDRLVTALPLRPAAIHKTGKLPYNTRDFPSNRSVLSGIDMYTLLPMGTALGGYEPERPVMSYDNPKGNPIEPQGPIENSLYGRTERTFDAASFASCSSRTRYGDVSLNPGKSATFANLAHFVGVQAMPESGGCGAITLGHDGIAGYQTSTGCRGCQRAIDDLSFTAAPCDGETTEYWVNFRRNLSAQKFWDARLKRIGINFGAPGDRYVPEDGMLWTHSPMLGKIAEAPPLVSVEYRGDAKSVYAHSLTMASKSSPDRGWVAASQVRGMTGMTVRLSDPLVGARATTPPALDGSLSDSCWTTGGRTLMSSPERIVRTPYGGYSMGQYSPSKIALGDTSYVMMRYDDTNLYIGGGLHALRFKGDMYIRVALGGREQAVSPVVLAYDIGDVDHTVTPTKQTTGIGSNDWQVAATKSATDIESFMAEIVVPWSALESAGLWKEQLVMNVEICYQLLAGSYTTLYRGAPDPDNTDSELLDYLCPVYLDAARGSVTQALPHTVRLHFAEMQDQAPGQRVFDVFLQGQKVATNLDVAAQAGGARRPLVKQITGVNIAERLEIDFAAKQGTPILSGVEVMAAYEDPTNVLPVAVAEASVVSGPAPLAVTLSARQSYDPDGQIRECLWETGDGRLARGSKIPHVFAEPGTYTVSLLVMDTRGGTTATNVVVTVGTGTPAAFVCSVKGSGGDYTSLAAWETALQSDLTSTQSLLFTVSSRGSYVPASHDGQTVTFAGGGSGILKHINANNIAYITRCQGAIQAGTVTGGGAFTIAGAGSRIYTAVAECWTNMAVGGLTVAGWTTSVDRCVSVRPAEGQGHTGKLKTAGGAYTGVTLTNLVSTDTAYTRIERLAIDPGVLRLGASGSASRVVGNMEVGSTGPLYNQTLKSGAIVANSIGASFRAAQTYQSNTFYAADVRFINCTAGSFLFGDATGFRALAINCLAYTNGAGFPADTASERWLARSVSADGTATNWAGWKSGNERNRANRTFQFADAAKGDYHLADVDAGARGLGGARLGADIDGQIRTGPLYDAGADQNFASNHAPEAYGQTLVAAQGVDLAIVLSGDDIDGDPITYANVGLPAHGTLTGSGTNRIYTADTHYTGEDSFTFKVNDGSMDSALTTVSITVRSNAQPVAYGQAVSAVAGQPKAINLVATDADGDALTCTIVTNVAHGMLEGTGTNLVYTSADGYSGADSFSFKVNDGFVDSSNAVVAITVAANHRPVANSQGVMLDEDTVRAIVLTASDADGDPLVVTNVTLPSNGALTGGGTNRTYTPYTNYHGPDSFTFRFWDGYVESYAATVSITVASVNDAPVSYGQNVAATSGVPVAVTLVADDADGDPLSFIIVTPPAHGGLTGSGSNVTYTSTGTYSGPDGFTFKVNDGAVDSATSTVTIGVIGSYTAVRNGRFNASDADTWGRGTNVYPMNVGDVANIGAYTVTASSVGEVAQGVAVNVFGSGSSTGVLWLADPGPASSVMNGVTVTVNSGGVYRIVTDNNVSNSTTVLNGGTLAFAGGSLVAGVLNVNADSLITPVSVQDVKITAVVHGSGKLTLTADATYGAACGFAAGSDWSGAWDIRGNIRFDNSTIARSVPGDVRVAPGKDMRLNGSATLVFKGVRSGSGTNTVYQGGTVAIGGTGKLSPGEPWLTNDVGSVMITSYSAGTNSPALVFSNNAIYAVDILGTSSYDRVKVVGTGSGTGQVTVASGTKLNVTLWTPTNSVTLDATVIDTSMANGNSGLLTGSFSTVNWSNATGWTGLVVTNINNDLHVMGSYALSNTDANTNGIPDMWETQYFGSTTNAQGAADADWDGDGLNNYGEWVAGTNPTNGQSVLAFSNVVQASGAWAVLRWSSESNRYYTLKLSTNLMLDLFGTVLTNRMPASPPMNVHTDGVGRPGGAFYKVIVEP